MNSIRKFILLAAGALCLGTLSSCNDIEGPDRFIELPPVEVDGILRNILLEEYTGQRCINCPNAHEAVAGLLSQPDYAERLIPVSIHCGGTAFSIGEGEMGPMIQGLRIPEGEDYYKQSGGDALPCGRLNRTSGILTYDAWGGAVRELAALESPLYMDMTPVLSDDGANINVALKLRADAAVSGKIVVWVLESGISSFQLMPNGLPVLDYVHNHVLRAVVGNPDGVETSLAADAETELSFSTPVRSIWNVDNLAIVAFMYNDSGVVQALEANLGENNHNIIIEKLVPGGEVLE